MICVNCNSVRRGCQAVWAGWGHASENPRLPESLHKNGVSFMGPPGKLFKIFEMFET
jgi:acetyl-CoA carboxylase/biotin carboxylase 1